MADEKPDLESLKQRRSNAQRNFTTRMNRLGVAAGRLREVDLSEELARLRGDYDKLLDASNEYIEAQGQIDPTGDDSESQNALARRDADEQKFLETEKAIMEMLWSKYAAPDIDALVTQFKAVFDRAEAFGRDKVVPWTQQEVEDRKLDRKLHELRGTAYTWRDYRPHGKDKWMLFLSLKEDKEQLMDEWTCRRRSEHDDDDDGDSDSCEEDKAEEKWAPRGLTVKQRQPVLRMLVSVTTKRGHVLGALINFASNANYITHRAAERLGLTGEPVSLVMNGVGKMTGNVDTKCYNVTINVLSSEGTLKFYEMICYGLDTITHADRVVSSERLEQLFQGLKPGELARPEKIDLMISGQESRLGPHALQRAGNLVLWDSPLGKFVSGKHPDLFEVEETTQHPKMHVGYTWMTAAYSCPRM